VEGRHSSLLNRNAPFCIANRYANAWINRNGIWSMIEAVGELLRAAAAGFVLPRYHALQSSDIKQKSSADVVTVVDHEVESFLAQQLMDLMPGSKVVGEEAAASRPSLYDLLSEDGTVWLIDPLDGTANFVAGVPYVSIMVALIKRGRTVASWMLDPLSDTLAICERGGGGVSRKEPHLCCRSRYCRNIATRRHIETLPSSRCSFRY
jgi:fructose-1,6-bisphosphatase/inositol monophosphatase family enzyme